MEVIVITARAITTRRLIFLRHLRAYLLYLLGFPVGYGALIHSVDNFVVFPMGFQLLFPLLISFLGLFDSFVQISQVSSEIIFQGCLVVPIEKIGLRDV